MKMRRAEDMEELSLELSIGGKYGKAEDLKEKTREFCVGKNGFVASRCDSPGVEALDPWRRREIQALRRQEARRKREEKVKKSRGVNGVGFVEDKLFMEARRFQARARDRESREDDCFLEGKNRENGSDEAGDELGISLFSEKECLSQCSSAFSDYHSMSQKGESSSDTGSHSSPMNRRHLDRIASHDSSSQAETDRCHGPAKVAPSPTGNPQPTWMSSSSPGMSSTLSKETSAGLNDNSTKLSSHGLNSARLPCMPCVSATGNGPNGRIVTGFLYRYSKSEVSIMCVCHGRSFSPAGFVEHAGGVDIPHPLRHITVVPFDLRRRGDPE